MTKHRTHEILLILWTWLAVIDSQNTRIVIPRTYSFAGNCQPLTLADLGSDTNFTDQGALAAAFSGINGFLPRPMVRILEWNLVCETQGRFRGTVSYNSAVVRFECLGTPCQTSNPAIPTELTVQIQFSCLANNMYTDPRIYVDEGSPLTRVPDANLTTPLRTDCGECTEAATNAQHCSGNLY